jgi:protein phosphatase
MSTQIDCFGMTDRGQVRKNNEDQFLVAELVKHLHVFQSSLAEASEPGWSRRGVGHLLVVADGMGGTAGGEIASGLTVETLSWYVTKTMPWFFRYQDGREEELENELREAVEACQRTVADAAVSTHYHHMGTTLTLGYVTWPRLYVVHAGDSRCYLFRGGVLHQMTRDHTVAQRAIDAGMMTPEQAGQSRFGHALWNCISGATDGVKPDLYRATLSGGDQVLLCTDGLNRHVPDEMIRGVMERAATPEAAVRELIEAANAAGGEDNITAVVARVRQEPAAGSSTTTETAVYPALPPR